MTSLEVRTVLKCSLSMIIFVNKINRNLVRCCCHSMSHRSGPAKEFSWVGYFDGRHPIAAQNWIAKGSHRTAQSVVRTCRWHTHTENATAVELSAIMSIKEKTPLTSTGQVDRTVHSYEHHRRSHETIPPANTGHRVDVNGHGKGYGSSAGTIQGQTQRQAAAYSRSSLSRVQAVSRRAPSRSKCCTA